MQKTVSLVLSSGGARGIAHVGVIEEIERRGYAIGSISGTSMGALVGGIYAAGGLGLFKEWMTTLDRMDVFSLVDFTISGRGLVKGDKVLKEMKKIIPDLNIEDLRIPYAAIATDIINGEEIVFEKGSLYDAIRASVSIPTVFTPFEYNGLTLVDGGVVNPIPINRVKRKKDDLLFVVDVNAKVPFKRIKKKQEILEERKLAKDKRFSKYVNLFTDKFNSLIPKNEKDKLGYINLISKSTNLMVHQISQMAIEKGKPDVLVNFPYEAYGIFDFYKAADIIQLGAEIAKLALDEFEKKG
ncbi:MAG: patatin-like phospholipase family protein [Bacteroidales bacterium]|jgi:NTE family protein|nr:patatin-like phospholipase family protein [Bacteroidales bacterium]